MNITERFTLILFAAILLVIGVYSVWAYQHGYPFVSDQMRAWSVRWWWFAPLVLVGVAWLMWHFFG